MWDSCREGGAWNNHGHVASKLFSRVLLHGTPFEHDGRDVIVQTQLKKNVKYKTFLQGADTMTPTSARVLLCDSPLASKFQNLSHKTMVVVEWKLSHDFFLQFQAHFTFTTFSSENVMYKLWDLEI